MLNIQNVQELASRLQTEIGRKIVGKPQEVKLLLTALLASGHILMEDVPGTGKTLLARTLAASVQCRFQRIQFTPDLLPSDLTGGHFYNQKESEFVFRPGPLFAHIVLADEINRATPRTQSSLLECMEEQQISIDGESHSLDDPFMVIATQNPVDNQGTFPLPEAQMDRFMLKMSLGYPSAGEGVEILRRTLQQTLQPVRQSSSVDPELIAQAQPADLTKSSVHGSSADDTGAGNIQNAVTRDELIAARRYCRTVNVHDDLLDYMVRIAEATRVHADTALGASPRATQALLRASQAYAAMHGRDYVLPDDIQTLAVPVLAHRIIFRSRHQNAQEQAKQLLNSIIQTESVPTEQYSSHGER
ncbi:AAA family ATPase [Paenibacillus sp. WLX1005]|uniref:AAA family ATPase n=1 Tax=Paenibacillus sp. WLX1005 TaxID=3243766 RepID=UPI003983FEBF